MSKLYPNMKPPKIKVKCMDCEDFDIIDMFCIAKQKDILDMYLEIVCGRFTRTKEVRSRPPTMNIFHGIEIKTVDFLEPGEAILVSPDAVNEDGEVDPSKVVKIVGLEEEAEA